MVFRLREKNKDLARINMVRYGLQEEGEEQGASQDQHGKDFSVNCLKTSQKMSNYQGLFVGSTCRLK